MKKIILFLLIIATVKGAIISGTIYDLTLEPTISKITINTTPKQTILSSNYEFEVEPGQYQIKAQQVRYKEIIATIDENITIIKNGSYHVDLILFPEFSEEKDLFEQIKTINFEKENNNNKYTWLIAFLLIILIITIILSLTKKKKKKRKKPKQKEPSLDEDAKKALTLIRINKRINQKELRKEFPLSEAKVSLIITELEEKGLIKKIKKGRGNILIPK